MERFNLEGLKTSSNLREPKNQYFFSQSKVPTILRWDHLSPYLLGVGKRTWFLHILEPQTRKMDLHILMRRGVSSSSIGESRINNIIVAYYEGVIKDYLDPDDDDEATNLAFGRSIYCNCDKTYYLGYTLGMEKHQKGIMVYDNEIDQQGRWDHGKILPHNTFEV